MIILFSFRRRDHCYCLMMNHIIPLILDKYINQDIFTYKKRINNQILNLKNIKSTNLLIYRQSLKYLTPKHSFHQVPTESLTLYTYTFILKFIIALSYFSFLLLHFNNIC